MTEPNSRDPMTLGYGVSDPFDRPFPARFFVRVILVFLCIPPALAFFMTLPLNTPGLAFSGPKRYEIQGWLVLLGVAFVLAMLVVVVRCMAYPSSRRHVGLPLVAIGLMWLSCMLASQLAENMWSFKGRFRGNRTALESVVSNIQKGTMPSLPAVVGDYTFKEIRAQPDGAIIFVISSSQNSISGFAYVPNPVAGHDDVRLLRWGGNVINYQGIRGLGGDWYVLFDEYRYGKRGWS
ncbi:MAG: hypothetical protein H6818_08815 [Phycisphaerales bacterium]|nr:hypothetical protein [Phycisphaerales bacterium]MCB9862672.1 hypothetical protein [Phycisphaerales bacterium]